MTTAVFMVSCGKGGMHGEMLAEGLQHSDELQR